MERRATAVWHGGLKDGKGSISTGSRALGKADGFAITKVHLDVRVRAPGADRAKFDAAAQKAKTGCPLSKVLKAAITMDARLDR